MKSVHAFTSCLGWLRLRRRRAVEVDLRVFVVAFNHLRASQCLTCLFAAGAVVTYRDKGWTWVSIGLTAATVILGLGSIIESLVLRIELTDDALIATDLLGRRRSWLKHSESRSRGE